MEVVEDFESRPQKAVSFVVKRDEGERGMERAEAAGRYWSGYSGGRWPGRSAKEKGREEGAVDEDGEERSIRSHIVQEVVA